MTRFASCLVMAFSCLPVMAGAQGMSEDGPYPRGLDWALFLTVFAAGAIWVMTRRR